MRFVFLLVSLLICPVIVAADHGTQGTHAAIHNIKQVELERTVKSLDDSTPFPDNTEYLDRDNQKSPVQLAAVDAQTSTAGKPVKTADSSMLSLSMPVNPPAVGQQFTMTINGVPASSLSDMVIACAPTDGLTWNAGVGLKSGALAFIDCTAAKGGQYTFMLAARDAANGMLSTTQVVSIGPAPTPIDPNPPGPLPPGPINPPGPVTTKFHVVLVYDSAAGAMTQDQYAMIYSMAPGGLRDYLAQKTTADTIKNAEGVSVTTVGYRMYQLNLDVSGAPQIYKDLFAKAAGKAGMVVDQNGTFTFFEFPKDSAAAIAILKPIGG